MSLKMTFDFNGLTVVDGYLKVSSPTISTDKSVLSFGIIYQASEGDPMLQAETYQCAYDIAGSDPFSQAYSYIKSLEKFSEATDIF